MSEIERLRDETGRSCHWRVDHDTPEVYETLCGNIFHLIDGNPADNKMKFCPFCGGRLVDESSSESVDDDDDDDEYEQADIIECFHCRGEGMDPLNDYLLPCPFC